MPRRIILEYDGFDRKVPVELLEDAEPEVCDEVWAILEKPLKMWPWHTVSTGQFYSAQGRPPRHPVSIGSQAAPRTGKGGRPLLLCDLKPGSICYAGANQLSFAYGDDITEPLPAKGPVFATVPQEHMADFTAAGQHVWNAQYRTHKIVVITASREEG